MKSRHDYLKNASKPLVVIYDLLRHGMILNILIDKKSVKLGQFTSLPEFCLMDIGKSDTGMDDIVLLQDFNLSIVMDVYEITESHLEELDEYYKYFHRNYDLNHNNRTRISTPYGEAYLYVNNRTIKEGKIIPSGDLEDYLEYKNVITVPTHKFKQLIK